MIQSHDKKTNQIETSMDKQRFMDLVVKLREFEGIEEVFLLNNKGEIEHTSEEYPLSAEDAKSLFNAWKRKEPSIKLRNHRFAVLKNDEIQLAAKNIAGGKGNIVGSVTKEGDYLVARTRDEGMILLEWSIFVNKVAWR